jgi:myosin heavy subunit
MDATLKLTPEEAAEPDGVPSKFKGEFKVSAGLTEESSENAIAGIPDMVDMDELNRATLLYNLANRYHRLDIYTWVGPILLVLNPFKFVAQYDGKEFESQYKRLITDPFPAQVKKEVTPHANAVSALAYSQCKR